MLGSKLDILDPKWLDVVFDGRNKAYGAYELRKEDPKNTGRALLIAVIFFVFVMSLPTIINKIQGFIPKADVKLKTVDVVILPPPPIDKVKPPPPPPEPPKPHTDQVRFPPPVVKPDNQIREKDPPTVKQLEVADPGQKELKGDPTQDVRIDEPVGKSDIKQVTEAAPDNQVFMAVEVEPEFPGGMDKFNSYLSNHIKYPAIAKENNVQGRVILQFVVERDGSFSGITVLRDPGSGLGDEAVRVLKSSPHWKPGIQNGKPVRVQFTLPVNFNLAGSE
jgi:protein TonB